MSTNYYTTATLLSSTLRKFTQTSHESKTQHIEKDQKPGSAVTAKDLTQNSLKIFEKKPFNI